MDKLSLLLAVGALALAGWTALVASDRDERLNQIEFALSEAHGANTALQVRLDRLEELPDEPSLLSAAEASPAQAPAGASPAGPAGLATRPPVAPLARLAELERIVARQDGLITRLEQAQAVRESAPQPYQRLTRDNLYFSSEQAVKALRLDERQGAELTDTLERAELQLKDLYAVPNDDGVAWRDLMQPMTANLGSEGASALRIVIPEFGKIAKFERGRIPGSSETYGEAQKRIRDNAFARVRDGLTPEQAKKWDTAQKDGLLRGGYGPAAAGLSITSFTSGAYK